MNTTLLRTQYAADLAALVYPGEVVVLELQLQAPGEAGAYQDEGLADRAFVQRIFADDGEVLAQAAGEVVEEDGATFLRFALDGAVITALLPSGELARDLRHIVYEVLENGMDRVFDPRPFVVRLQDDPSVTAPVSAEAVDGDPSTRFVIQRSATAQRITLVSKGARGLRGKSAYELAVDNGFVGTEAQWLATLQPFPANGATLTDSAPLFDLSQTWNDAIEVFTAARVNIVDTASAVGSLLLDLQLGGASKFAVRKDGQVIGAAGAAFAAAVTIAGAAAWTSADFDPSDFAQGAHTHAIADVTGLQGALDGEASARAAADSGLQDDIAALAGATSSALALKLDAADYTAADVFAKVLTLDGAGSALDAGLLGGQDSDWYRDWANLTGVPTTASGWLTDVVLTSGDQTVGGAKTFSSSLATGGDLLLNTNTGAIRIGASADVILVRDAANILAQRNGTAAQAKWLYHTYTDPSNYEAVYMAWQSNEFRIGTIRAGTGSQRSLAFGTNASMRWQISTSGHFLAYADNTYDIGALAASRPRNLYLAGTISTGGSITSGTSLVATTSVTLGAANGVNWLGRSVMRSPSDGVISLADAAETSFNRLNFGGPGATSPALARDGAGLASRLADNTAGSTFRATRYLFTNSQYIDTSGSDGWLFSNSAGTAYAHVQVEAANSIAFRNGANPHSFSIYNTWTDPSNYERGWLYWTSNAFRIGTFAAGTGASRDVVIGGENVYLRFGGLGGTNAWRVTSGTGHFLAAADNTYDIGGSGANRPRSLYTASHIVCGGSLLFGSAGGVATGGGDGRVLLRNNNNDNFDRLCFGGLTASFPSLKRSTTGLIARLADDSADTWLQASVFLAGDGSAGAPGLSFVNAATTGFFHSGGEIRVAAAGVQRFSFAGTQFVISSSAGSLSFAGDTILVRDAANTLAQRNGVNAQGLNVYNTYTDGSNYERGMFRWSSNELAVGVEALGTGTKRGLRLEGSSISIRPLSGSTNAAWSFNTQGHFLAAADNTYDIGASGATRPRHVYAGSSFTGDGGAVIQFAGRARLRSPADAVLLMRNAADNDFSMLLWGGLTSAFPALKKSAEILQARLADDSDFTVLQAKLRTHANANAETPVATHTLLIEDASGTQYKVLAVAA